jgi:hypothetical protein
VTLIFPLLLVALTAPGEVAAATPSGPSSPAPVVLSLQGGESVPLLGLSRSQAKDGSPGPLQVVYWVGPDAGVLAPLEGREIEQVRARLVFEAFRAWAGANDVSEVVVSIVAGLPGEPGRVLDVPWKRTGGTTWAKRKPTVAEITLPRFPIPSRVGAPDPLRTGRRRPGPEPDAHRLGTPGAIDVARPGGHGGPGPFPHRERGRRGRGGRDRPDGSGRGVAGPMTDYPGGFTK